MFDKKKCLLCEDAVSAAKEIVALVGASERPVCVPVVGLPESGKTSMVFDMEKRLVDCGVEVVVSDRIASELRSGQRKVNESYLAYMPLHVEFETARRVSKALASGRSVVVDRSASVPEGYRHCDRRALERLRNLTEADGAHFIPLFVNRESVADGYEAKGARTPGFFARWREKRAGRRRLKEAEGMRSALVGFLNTCERMFVAGFSAKRT